MNTYIWCGWNVLLTPTIYKPENEDIDLLLVFEIDSESIYYWQ